MAFRREERGYPMKIVDFIVGFDSLLLKVLAICYLYQILYTVIGLLFKPHKLPEDVPLKRYAALICARNEENVIGEVIDSLKKQNYPADLLDIYVLADNCTDHTAAKAESHGATVFKRNNPTLVGKGYGLDYLLRQIRLLKGSWASYDGYFIFDADNIVDENFVTSMNKTFSKGYDAITCYRSSKNFGESWVTAGYSIQFLREARFLNNARQLVGVNCAVSGTGFMVSSQLIEENRGWPYHLLTEDIEFTVHSTAKGKRIGYCDEAIVYDEQPVTFALSWRQRMRWARGFFQVMKHYGLKLIIGMFRGGLRNLASCYDMFMTVAPATLLTVFGLFLNIGALVACYFQPHLVFVTMIDIMIKFLKDAFGGYYVMTLLYGLLTVVKEWNRIPANSWDKVRHLLLFPLFIISYIPNTVASLLMKVEWHPIAHSSTKEIKARQII